MAGVRVYEVIDKMQEVILNEVDDPLNRDDDKWVATELPDDYTRYPQVEIYQINSENEKASVGRAAVDQRPRIQVKVMHDTSLSHRIGDSNKKLRGEAVLDEVATQIEEAIIADMDKDVDKSTIRSLSNGLTITPINRNPQPLDNSISAINIDFRALIERG